MRPSVVASARLIGAGLGLIASAALAAHGLDLVRGNLPGCSTTSGCGALTSGAWGVVPGTNWPWSFVGVAWFIGLLSASLPPDRPPWWMRVAAVCGVLVSVALSAVMVVMRSFCPWCALAHVGMVVFAIGAIAHSDTVSGPLRERRRGGVRAARASLVAVVASALLGVLHWRVEHRRAVAAESAEEAMVSTPAPVSTSVRLESGQPLVERPEAPLRIVMFTDYQCPDCARVEQSVERIAARSDVSISIKHFPLCAGCNVHVPTSLHPDACRRAAIAEVAARLGGETAFQSAHRTLFRLQSEPATDPLDAVSVATGLARDVIESHLADEDVADAIRNDVADAVALGVTFTPMVFVNGHEWKWYATRGSLEDLVNRCASASQPHVSPADAAEKLIDDWRLTTPIAALSAPTDRGFIALGVGQTDHHGPEVRAWIDARLPGSRELMEALRALNDQGVPFQLRVLQCPASSGCTPAQGLASGDPLACMTAAAIVAARRCGGDAGARAMLEAVVDADPLPGSNDFAGIAASIGLDPSCFARELDSPETRDMVREEARLLTEAARLRQIPSLVIDGRPVARWSHPGAETAVVLRGLIESAGRQ